MAKLSPDYLDLESISLLSSTKIFSVDDFLLADIDKIVLNSKLTAEDALRLKHTFSINYSSCPSNAWDLFSLKDKDMFIKTHVEGIDKILSGGILKGSLLELCGPSGCGKTQICHSLAVNCAIDSVIVDFVDTKGDFSASRCNILLPAGLKDEEMDDILDHINVYSSQNIYELISVLEKIHTNLKRGIKGKDKLLIIDSITVPYLPFIGIPSSKGISLLNYISAKLKQMATEHNIVVVLTNLGVIFNENEEDHVGSNIQEVKPLMGKYWQHIPNTRIIITRDADAIKRRMIVQKSDYLAVNTSTTITISRTGVS
ncbi:DNA repair protein RAD51 homolog 4 [Halyomorpha halys]|uniref:DNA repair protein RAD51 homolog 4-like n=1 Tax=Halyomorpha halys TaxID=286706 RepID=UPI0006D50558|nr:DNA repair protein RAD51 homolog 4 [Halyomorpha halys]